VSHGVDNLSPGVGSFVSSRMIIDESLDSTYDPIISQYNSYLCYNRACLERLL